MKLSFPLIISVLAVGNSLVRLAEAQEDISDLCPAETGVIEAKGLPEDNEGPGVECDDGKPILLCTVNESSLVSDYTDACSALGGKAAIVDVSVDCKVYGGAAQSQGIDEVHYDFENLQSCVGMSCSSNDLELIGKQKVTEAAAGAELALESGNGGQYECEGILDDYTDTSNPSEAVSPGLRTFYTLLSLKLLFVAER